MNIINKLHTTKPPLTFPNVIARLYEAMEISYLASGSDEAVPKARPITAAVMENIIYPYVQPPPPQPHFYQEQPACDATQMPQGYGWGQLQEDMANLNKNQTEFYDSILAEQAAYGLCLQDLETRQKDMWAEQNKQELRGSEAEIANMNHTFLTLAVDSEAKNYYTCWGLQQLAPSLAPVPPTNISSMIQRNVKENKPMFGGMLRPLPVGESSTGDKGKAPIDKDATRYPNANSDDE
ncbi:hypothetical protein PIB30_076807 [Stylosanthes scabra]|uniref:Uncharacterized protein n=1 Tax=Stylosanthes scabra TaxID=79078 RepID=A0ABU6VPH0_9FABA|nr:hypothetical protein [Stylosanthes scabra]